MKVHPTALIEPGATIGAKTVVWHFSHVREGATIGIECTLGQNVYIDVNVLIGDRCKIQNGVSVYNGVTIEDDVFIGPNATFTNDLYPRAFGEWTLTSTRVKRGASIGANATIVCGVTIGEFAMVGAGAVVCRDVPSFALVVGNPATVIGTVCMQGHRDCLEAEHA